MKLQNFLLGVLLCITFSSVQAQAPVRTTVTLPDWGVAGNDKATYYYIPATETYYDVRKGEYVYQQDGKWVRTNTLPTAYKDYDLYSGYKVVLTDDKEPFDNYEDMRVKYAKTYKGEEQKTYKVKKNRNGKVKIKEK
jgi:hypothetical protein